MKNLIFVGLAFFAFMHNASGQLYFPPASPGVWQTVTPQSLGWCVNEIDSLEAFLQSTGTKGFVILKDGKIAYEKYFKTFTQDSLWYWASAGKSLFAFLMGQAIESGHLTLADTVSKYLGNGWTSCTSTDENKILVEHLLAMNSGLNDNVPNKDCMLPACLTCLAAPNTRWAYHNAPYTLSHKVLENASGQNLNAFTNQKLKSKIGMTGLWITIGDNEVYFSRLRDMARFGLLMQSNGIWSGDTLLKNNNYFNAMINTSQNLNLSYGLLWWLNGKNSFMLPGVQIILPSSLIPNAPIDTWCALGKDDQKIYISQSSGMVVARMGNDAGYLAPGPSGYDNILWNYINRVICNTQSIEESSHLADAIYPNPAQHFTDIYLKNDAQVNVYNAIGKMVYSAFLSGKASHQIPLPKGFYLVEIIRNGQSNTHKLMML
jgi:CubicO group peptidase (beta-lactamase class C family)